VNTVDAFEEIQEELLLRAMEIVELCGTHIASSLPAGINGLKGSTQA
jgi:hypothetical protein